MKTGLFYLFLGWSVIVILMAVTDAYAPDYNFRVSSWLVLFFVGTLLSVWVLIMRPVSHKKAEHVAAIATVFLAGLFLGVYNLTWQISVYIMGLGRIFPLPLYPFPFTVDAFGWYLMIGIGFSAISLSIYLLSRERFR